MDFTLLFAYIPSILTETQDFLCKLRISSSGNKINLHRGYG